MKDRKHLLFYLAGLGFDELVEVVTWFQLDCIRNLCLLLLRYWDDWFRLIEKMAKHKFVDPSTIFSPKCEALKDIC